METFRRCILAVLLILPSLLFAGEVININTADKETLMSITGIGESRADAIIAYRDQHGPFKSVDQLTEIKGVGQTLVEKNRDSLVVKE